MKFIGCFRTKRWTDPQKQIHRRRRNEILYSKYNRLIKDLLKKNPHIHITPIAFRSDQSEAKIILQIINSVNSLANQLHQSISRRRRQRLFFGSLKSVSPAIAQRVQLWKRGVKVHIKHSKPTRNKNINPLYITKSVGDNLRRKLSDFCKSLAKHLEEISSGLRIAHCK